MKVKALRLFNDLQSKKLRKYGEIFEVSEKRAVELSSAQNGTLVEVIDKPQKESGEQNVGKNQGRSKAKK